VGYHRSTRDNRPLLVFLHPSDELYGADRMLLEMVGHVPAGVRAEVWVPTDLLHPSMPLCAELMSRGVMVRHFDLPVLRRDYSNPLGAMILLRRCVRLARKLRRFRPAAVYCTTSASFLAAPVARLSGVHRVFAHVQEIWSDSDRLVLSPMAAASKRLVAISTPVAERLPARLRGRLTVVPNGSPEPQSVEVLQRPADTGLTYLVASRWNNWKGHRTLLQAWEKAGAPGRLIVLGGAPLSGEWVDVPALVADLTHPDRVDVPGEVPDIAGYIDAADVVVVPSDQPEPFGLIAIEAFARGRPVIGSAGGGLRDIITDGIDGWSYPMGDVDALAAVISGLDRTKVEEAARQARKTYESRFTVERFAEHWRQTVFGAR
jgi:glycosyltransferase involved in cell wall biosynthesis